MLRRIQGWQRGVERWGWCSLPLLIVIVSQCSGGSGRTGY
jgi:hypothetical protein